MKHKGFLMLLVLLGAVLCGAGPGELRVHDLRT